MPDSDWVLPPHALVRRTASAICIAASFASLAHAQKGPPLGPTASSATPGSRAPAVAQPHASAVTLTADDANAWLDGYLPYALEVGDIAGAVVAIVKDGQILTMRGYGFSDVAKRAPVDPRTTLFRPGSVSKLITWTAVMQQVEAGKIDLDTDVNRYLDFAIPPRNGKPITMRALMQHTAGFEEQAKDIMSTNGTAVPAFDAILKRWTPKRIFDVGTTPAYSNYGASLAGYIVQRVSGEPFAQYVERHILTPLDMTHSTFRQPLPANLAPLMSKGYTAASEKADEFEMVGPAPAGSLSSTAEDMAHFMIAHLEHGAYHGNHILQPATVELMHNSPLTMLPPLNRMELGFFETNVNGREVIAHLGDSQDFHTSLHLFLKEGVGFYVSFNSLGKAGAAGGLRGALFEDFADRYLPGDTTRARVDSVTAATHAAMMAGTWIVSRRSESNFINATELVSEMKIGAHGGKIVVALPGLNGEPRTWVETTPFVWRDANSHEQLAAKVVDGAVVRWSIGLLSPFMVFDRAPWYKNSAWLLPLFGIALAALVITAVRWPVAAIVRRHYGATLGLDPRARRAYRWSRVAALAIVVAMLGWTLAFTVVLGDGNRLNSSSDGIIHVVQLFGVVAIFGGLGVMLWNAWVVWTGQRRWPARTWSVVLTLSAVMVLWVAVAFKLTSFSVNY